MRANHADILDAIRESKDLSDDTKTKLKSALDQFGKTFA
jgi:F-type H+-transporting ATPase subunit alpha